MLAHNWCTFQFVAQIQSKLCQNYLKSVPYVIDFVHLKPAAYC